MLENIKKRDGRIVKFNDDRITRAIFLAASEVAKEENVKPSYEMSEELTQRVIKILNSKFRDEVPGVEDIQDVVVKVLIEGGHARTSEKYITYRNERSRIRNSRTEPQNRYFEEDRLARTESAREASSARAGQPTPTNAIAGLKASNARSRRRGSRPPAATRHWVPCLSPMRIVSLVPHATELLFALGLGDQVVAVTHECDYPPRRPTRCRTITRDVLPGGLSAAEIDARRARAHRARRGDLRARRASALRRARARPDRHPGAVPGVRGLLRRRARGRRATIPSQPQVDRAGPAHARRDARRRPHARPGAPARARRALDLVARQRARIDARALAVRRPSAVPVAALEWLDPVFVAGHWTPQLIELAGGIDVLGLPGRALRAGARGRRSRPPRPEVVVAMPCGYDAERSRAEADGLRRRAARRSAPSASSPSTPSAYFSRPGPRLVDGLELMAHVLHPDRVPEARGRGRSRSRSDPPPAAQPRPPMPLPPATAIAPTTRSTDSTAQPSVAELAPAPCGRRRSKRHADEGAADQAADVAADRDAR